MLRPTHVIFRWLESRIKIDAGYSLSRQPQRGTLSFLRFHLNEVRLWLLLIFTTSLGFSVFEAFLFLSIGWGIDGLRQSRESGADFAALAYIAIGSILVVRPLLFFLSHVAVDQIVVPNLSARVRWRSHLHTMKQPIPFFMSQPVGRIANRIVQSGDAVRGATIEVFDNISYVLVFCAITLGFLVTLNKLYIIVFLTWFLAFVFVISCFVTRARIAARDNAAARSVFAGRIVDVYTNATTVKLFSRTSDENSRLQDDLEDWAARHRHLTRLTTISTTALEILNSALIAIFALLSLELWKSGAITEGEIAATLGLVLRIVGMSGWIMYLFKGVFDALGTVRDSMDTFPTDVPVEIAETNFRFLNGSIAFHKVSFHHHKDRPLFNDFTLKIEAGQKIGIVGQSGAGKSTILDLVLGLHVASSGDVLLDGQSVRSLDRNSLWRSMTLVSTQVPLLNRSVRENIALARPSATLEEIENAAELAYATEFVHDLVDSEGRTGFDAFVGGSGRDISAGQRQRIMLARAFLKDSPVLLLDEATSALDPRLEWAVTENIISWLERKRKTALVVSHRLSTLTTFDRIMVLDRGTIVEDGNHCELMSIGGRYAELWRIQNRSD